MNQSEEDDRLRKLTRAALDEVAEKAPAFREVVDGRRASREVETAKGWSPAWLAATAAAVLAAVTGVLWLARPSERLTAPAEVAGAVEDGASTVREANGDPVDTPELLPTDALLADAGEWEHTSETQTLTREISALFAQ